jgi:hypothetical protein
MPACNPWLNGSLTLKMVKSHINKLTINPFRYLFLRIEYAIQRKILSILSITQFKNTMGAVAQDLKIHTSEFNYRIKR